MSFPIIPVSMIHRERTHHESVFAGHFVLWTTQFPAHESSRFFFYVGSYFEGATLHEQLSSMNARLLDRLWTVIAETSI